VTPSARTALCAFAWLLAGPIPAHSEATFDYLYVEANEGGSSGGHAALREREQVFHFANRDGLLVLARESTQEFVHAYALLGNRDIHVSRVAVQAADRDRIAAELDDYFRVQSQQLDVRAALREDRELLESWLEDPSRIDVPALGYFSRDATHGSTDLRALRVRIEAHAGAEVLRALRERAQARLAHARAHDPAGWTFSLPRDRRDRPAFAQAYARRVVDAAAGLAALDLLERGAPLAGDALVELDGPDGQLSERERAAIASRRAALEGELLRLAGSGASDWGRPFVVGAARWLAAGESLRRGRLVLLDVLPRDGVRLAARVVASRRDVVAEIQTAAREDLTRGRAAIAEGSELVASRLEETLSRVVELERAVTSGRDLRLARGALVPSRPGTLHVALPTPAAERDRLERALGRVREREDAYQRALADLYGYELLTRNCVSELFETLNEAFGGSRDAVRGALGGYVDGYSTFEYIPFVSARAVDARYRVVHRRTLPSWRALQLQAMRDHEHPLWVALRESNTFTAQSYRRGVKDSFFLFFSEDAVALRPLFGVFNLTAALGESLWGLPMWLVDGGDTARAGMRGMLTSLPELAFGNIRKGSNDWVAPRAQPLDD
jgi:hypothetical protein